MKMKRTLTSITLVIFAISLLVMADASAMAQTGERAQAQLPGQSDSPDTPCQSTLIFGSGASKFRICITPGGNILDLESPQGFNHMTNSVDGIYGDGYVLCSGPGPSFGAYDAFGAGEGFGPPTFTQPGGFNTLPLTITRSTTDGRFELRQTFEWNPLEKEVAITMALRNTSGFSMSAVKLARYFDGDMDNTVLNDIYDADSDSVWAREGGTGANHHGLSLTALSFAQPHATTVEEFKEWDPTGTEAQTARFCTPVAHTVPTARGDYVGRLTYALGTIPAGATKTVKVIYRRF